MSYAYSTTTGLLSSLNATVQNSSIPVTYTYQGANQLRSKAIGSVNIWLAAAFIGICTCLLSALGVKIGNVFGSRYEKKAELAGGVILILLGVKILLEHLGVLT